LCELRVRSVAFCGPRPISALRTSNAALRTHVLRRHGLRRRTQTPPGHSSASPTRRVIICTSRRDSGRPRESLSEIFRSFAARSTSDGFPANSVFFEGKSSALHNPQAPSPAPQPKRPVAVRTRGSAKASMTSCSGHFARATHRQHGRLQSPGAGTTGFPLVSPIGMRVSTGAAPRTKCIQRIRLPSGPGDGNR
jgi:hypothetical protein